MERLTETCTCDDACDDPCPRHARENMLEAELTEARRERDEALRGSLNANERTRKVLADLAAARELLREAVTTYRITDSAHCDATREPNRCVCGLDNWRARVAALLKGEA